MKINRGDRVRYKTVGYTGKICEYCGHEELDAKVIERKGIVSYIFMDYVEVNGEPVTKENIVGYVSDSEAQNEQG